MKSPFPGMNPYLEDDKIWPRFQHQLLLCLQQMILPGLMDRYRVRIGQRSYTAEQVLFTSVTRVDYQDEALEVRQRTSGTLVTLVEVVSPANKTLPDGRRAYLDRRQGARAAGANVVEIDLVLQGQPTLSYSRQGLQEWDYAVTVTRGGKAERHEIYATTLPAKLRSFRLPLMADDRDTAVDLQAAVSRCCDQGDFVEEIDYARDPVTRLTDGNRAWLHKFLIEQNRRIPASVA